MPSKLMYLVAALGVTGAGLARADKLPKGTEHTPPYFAEESRSAIHVGKKDDGWGPHLGAGVANLAEHDHARVVIRQGAKTLAEVKCDQIGHAGPAMQISCEATPKGITTVGATEWELVVKDDKTDKEYSVRTYKVAVKNWKNWPATNKDKLWGNWGEDLGGPAWADMQDDQAVHFIFWVNSSTNGAGSTLRCSVDGKPLDQPLKGAMLHSDQFSNDTRNAKGDTIQYVQTHVNFKVDHLYWGTDKEIKDHSDGGEGVKLSEHPGAWVCQIRRDQATLREFAFTVKDGKIQQDEMNTGKGAIPTIADVAMIEMHIPKEDVLDDAIPGDKWKSSMIWGLAWPDHPKVKKIQADFPSKGKLGVPQ